MKSIFRFACLGSGSGGNAWVLSCGRTHVLLDAGFSAREITRRLARLGLAPTALHAVLLTHEHGDHVRGVGALARRYGLPVYGSAGTLRAIERMGPFPALRPLLPETVYDFAGLAVMPFPVPHDAAEPYAYTFSDGAQRLGLVTDLGGITPAVVAHLQACHGLVLECNHDAGMLLAGVYPWRLKERIRGEYGHLSNAQSAALLAMLKHDRLSRVVAAHLSGENNMPILAQSALAEVMDWGCAEIGVADQDEGLCWQTV